MKHVRILAPLLAALACSACSVSQMRLPSDLATAAERQPFAQMTGWRNGKFSVGEYRGTYHRELDRASLFGFKETRGEADFTVAGPGISSSIEGKCRVREHALVLEDIEFKPKPMALRCDFTADGIAIPARFELQESRALGPDILMRYARRGEIGLAGQVIQFRSVHDVEGAVLPTASPIGYVFEQDGQTIGAVELNGRAALIMPPGTDIDRRRAMTVAAVALATFWDPDVVGD